MYNKKDARGRSFGVGVSTGLDTFLSYYIMKSYFTTTVGRVCDALRHNHSRYRRCSPMSTHSPCLVLVKDIVTKPFAFQASRHGILTSHHIQPLHELTLFFSVHTEIRGECYLPFLKVCMGGKPLCTRVRSSHSSPFTLDVSDVLGKMLELPNSAVVWKNR